MAIFRLNDASKWIAPRFLHLSPLCKLTYIWLYDHAEPDGSVPAISLPILQAQIGAKTLKTYEDVGRLLERVAAAGLIQMRNDEELVVPAVVRNERVARIGIRSTIPTDKKQDSASTRPKKVLPSEIRLAQDVWVLVKACGIPWGYKPMEVPSFVDAIAECEGRTILGTYMDIPALAALVVTAAKDHYALPRDRAYTLRPDVLFRPEMAQNLMGRIEGMYKSILEQVRVINSKHQLDVIRYRQQKADEDEAARDATAVAAAQIVQDQSDHPGGVRSSSSSDSWDGDGGGVVVEDETTGSDSSEEIDGDGSESGDIDDD